MIQYDENVLQQFAESLYREAARIVYSTAIFFGFIALILGFAGSGALAASDRSVQYPVGGMTLLVAILGAAIGAAVGKNRSFHLKLEAQKILLQIQIERNTRRTQLSA